MALHGSRSSMSPPAKSDPGDRRHEIVLRVARRCFTREGFSATKMEPIAREAGISTATLYALFPSKEHLFMAVIDQAAGDFAAGMSQVQGQADGNARQQLTQFMTAYAGFMGDPFIRSIFRLVMAERPRFPDLAIAFFERGRTSFGSVLIQAMVRLAQNGELKIDKPSWAAGQLMGMVEHPIFFVPLVTGDEVQSSRTHASIADEAVETFIRRYGT